MAAESAGIHVVDVSDPASPVLLGSTPTRGASSNAADLLVRGSRAYVADGAFNLGGAKVIDFSDPSTPFVVGESSNAFGLSSLDLDGAFALGADYFYVNAVPIFNVEVEPPLFNSVLDFRALPDARDDNGMGVVARDGLVYLAGDRRNVYRFGAAGDSALYIGRYVLLEEINNVPRPPSVVLTSPVEGASIRERRTLSLRADATDDVRVDSVRFLVNGQVVATDFDAPFGHDFLVSEGVSPLTIVAEADDLAGNRATSEPVVVTVLPDGAPVVRILAPVSGAVLRAGRTRQVTAHASDDVQVVRVDFFVGDVLAASRTAPPYRFNLVPSIEVTSLSLTAVARDDAGQTATSEAVVVQVEPTEPPIVRILEPHDGDRVSAGDSVRFVVGATDDVAISQVRYLVDGVAVETHCCEPFEVTFQVGSGATEVRLVAEATDSSGQTRRSAEVVLTVIGEPTGENVLEGRVLDDEGAPVAGAEVECRASFGVLFGLTGPAGTFRIPYQSASAVPVLCLARFTTSAGELRRAISWPREVAPRALRRWVISGPSPLCCMARTRPRLPRG
ncbi:MAG: hypothetical protein HC882_07040 [Acidobacteria bacterium]|nr:hypothetical protein [Acidobacteriota bacterium]